MMSLVRDDQVELRRRFEFEQSAVSPSAVNTGQVWFQPEQLVVNDGTCVLLRPLALKIGLVEAIAQRLRGEDAEILIETAHLGTPFGGEGLRAENQDPV